MAAMVTVGFLPGLTDGASAAPSPNGSGAQPALIDTWAKAAHVPPADVAGIRAGTLHTASGVDGADWAMATFSPSAQAPAAAAAGFQDGAATAVFTRHGQAAWRVVALGPEQGTCHNVLPPSLRQQWGLTADACPSPASMHGAAAAATSAPTAMAGTLSGAGFGAAIARIALGQVGVGDTPSSNDFSLDCDPYSTLVGPPIPTAIGCGADHNFAVVDQNETWCSDFVKWVWQQAGVTADMDQINAAAVSFYAWGQAQGQPLTVDSAHPQVGDAVVFFPPGDVATEGYADHVGVVTAVNPDGTIDMANGDFAGATHISVEYDQHIDLSTWASQVWNPGEQWVFVAPPAAPQAPTPQVAVAGPHQAVAGTVVSFTSQATEPGGSVAGAQWTFGDGGSATTPDAAHVFGEPGPHTVTFTATSNEHTVTTRTWTVNVAGASGAVTAKPSNAVWYSATPVTQQAFRAGPDGTVLEERSNSGGWTAAALPVTAAPGTRPTAVELPAADDSLQPRVLAETPGGAVVESTPSGSGWSTTTLPGTPAAATGVAGLAVPAATSSNPQPDQVEAYFVGGDGHIVQAAERNGSWDATTLPGPSVGADHALAAALSMGVPTGSSVAHGAPAGSLARALFYVDGSGRLTAAVDDGQGGWHSVPVPAAQPAPDTPLAAVTAPGGTGVDVFFVDGAGHLAEAVAGPGAGHWSVTAVPGAAPAAAAGLSAADDLLPSGSVQPEVAWVDSAGQPRLSSDSAGTWTTVALPGMATALDGLSAYPEYVAPGEVKVPGPTEGTERHVYLEQEAGPVADATSRGGTTFDPAPLPAAATTIPQAVVLYGASADAVRMAEQAAAFAGLPPAQVTGSFATAWDDTLDGHHLVITVGQSSTDALYFNVCGWATPSGTITGSTPFGYVVGPTDALPGADLFENGTAYRGAGAQQRADDLAYEAAHGSLPPGVTDVPPAGPALWSCTGTP